MRTLLACLALIASTAFAADTEEQLVYRFDMILFENVADGKAYTDATAAREFVDRKLEQKYPQLTPVGPVEPIEPVEPNQAPALGGAEEQPAEAAGPDEFTPDDPEVEFRELEAGELDAALAEIEQSSQYRVLAHRRWQQLGLEDGDSIRIEIQSPPASADDDPPALAGSVTFTFSRYIHLNTDLVMIHQTPPAAATPAAGEIVIMSTPSGQIIDPANAEKAENGISEPRLDSSRIVVERKLRSREIHYIDHPLLGILVNIERERVKTPVTEAGTQAAAGS